MISLAFLVISAVLSWYIPTFFKSRGPVIEISLCALILIFAGSQLWISGPNPIMFGMVIGSGWFLLSRTSDLVFPFPTE